MKKTLLFLAASSLLMPVAFASPTPADSKPEALVVLIPGAGASGSTLAGFPRIIGNQYFGYYEKHFKAEGLHTILCPQSLDNDTRNLEERAAECSQIIAKEESTIGLSCATSPHRNVVLVGHSMGGLIGRLLAHDDAVAGCLSSILMLSTPNQGTQLADFAIERIDSPHDIIGEVLRAINFGPKRNRYLPEMRADHSHDPASTFVSQTIADNPDVAYYSISDSFKRNATPLEVTNKILSALVRNAGLDKTPYGDKNDGIVPEYSQIYGTYLGHLTINHWQMACVDPMKTTVGCQEAAALVIPTVKKLAAQTN